MSEMELEIKECDSPGYHPQVDFNQWRVALANYAPNLERGAIKYLERHLETDEVFVLISGFAGLLIGLDSKEFILEPGKIYNVKKGTWHRVFMSKNSKILIVENADTSSDNTQYYHFA